jgi:hypothetical protein
MGSIRMPTAPESSGTIPLYSTDTEEELSVFKEISDEAECNIAEFFSILNEWNQKYLLEEDCHRERINKI